MSCAGGDTGVGTIGGDAIGIRSGLGTPGIAERTIGLRGREVAARAGRAGAGGGGVLAGGVARGWLAGAVANVTDNGTLTSFRSIPGNSSGWRSTMYQIAATCSSSDNTNAIQNNGIVTTSLRRGGSSNQGR